VAFVRFAFCLGVCFLGKVLNGFFVFEKEKTKKNIAYSPKMYNFAGKKEMKAAGFGSWGA